MNIKASELITLLQKAIESNGDLNVVFTTSERTVKGSEKTYYKRQDEDKDCLVSLENIDGERKNTICLYIEQQPYAWL